jgi:hypothetical protein
MSRNSDLGQVDRAWRCDCGDSHFLSVMYWKNDPRAGFDVSGEIRIEGSFGAGLRQRAKHIWQMLCGRGHIDTWVGVCLDADTAREIAGVLEDYAREWDEYLAGLKGKASPRSIED